MVPHTHGGIAHGSVRKQLSREVDLEEWQGHLVHLQALRREHAARGSAEALRGEALHRAPDGADGGDLLAPCGGKHGRHDERDHGARQAQRQR